MARSRAVTTGFGAVVLGTVVWLPPVLLTLAALTLAANGAGGVPTVTWAVVGLLAMSASVLVVVTSARLVSTAPGRTSLATFTTMTKVAVAPAAKEGTVLVMMPPEPTGGLVEVHPGAPELETKVVRSG